MTDPFEPKGKPTREQCRTVYNSIAHPTCDKLHAKLTERGFKISRATCSRLIKVNFEEDGRISGIRPGVAKALREKEEAKAEAATEPKAEAQPEVDDLIGKTDEQLRAIQKTERLRCNIALLRAARRKADALVVASRDAAAFMDSATEIVAFDDLKGATTAPAVDETKMIDVTPNQSNPVSDAIRQFKRERQAA